MSTFSFLLIRSLQILRSSAYSFAVQCSPSWFIFVPYTKVFGGGGGGGNKVHYGGCKSGVFLCPQ